MLIDIDKVIKVNTGVKTKIMYRLCGGTFFTLILQAIKQKTSIRKKFGEKTDGLSDKEVFSGLVKIFYDNYDMPKTDSFRTIISKYKNCEITSSEYLPMNDNIYINRFNEEIKNNYNLVIQRTNTFILNYIDSESKGQWLASSIIELVHNDSYIDQELFYVLDSNKPINKNELINLPELSLSNLIAGIWHYIIVNKIDNSIGKNTIDMWLDSSVVKGSQRPFISDIGNNSSVSVIIPSDLEEDHLLHKDEKKIKKVGNNPFSHYIKKITEKYNRIKTLLYSETPKPFYSFYVCNDIIQKIQIKRFTYKNSIIKDANVDLLSKTSNFILITGTGGLGKSMMMRHLLLDSANKFPETNKLPIFIQLKNFNSNYTNMLEFIVQEISSLANENELNRYQNYLNEGNCVFLFDGLDEISSKDRNSFESILEDFTDVYSNNLFIMSSRPTSSFINYQRFTELRLSPFSKEQALELIDKLEFRPDEPKIKLAFKEQLNKSLYYSHREFSENPLLLTIMLLTFEQFAEVPSKMHIFYREAYVSLSQKHDASKGAFKRVLKTGLSADKFSDYFSEFCARTYKDEKYEFTDLEFEKYFNSLNINTKTDQPIKHNDFLSDLINNMCLMYYESNKYHFTHRSFQEYFCALFFSKQKDKTLKHIGDFFENKRNFNFSDKTFSMLYDMIPEKIDEYIFLPYLEDLLKECKQNNDYWTFLINLYPSLRYSIGETDEYIFNYPESFIYEFIILNKRLHESVNGDEFPECDEFATTNWVLIDENWEDLDEGNIIPENDVPSSYIYEFGTPSPVGVSYEIDTELVFNNKEDYLDIYNILNSDTFPLRIEFENINNYFEDLQNLQRIDSDDFFDLFQ